MEEVAHVVEAREVDMAVLLPLVLLPLDRVPLIEVAVGGLLPLHRHRHRHRRRRRRRRQRALETRLETRDGRHGRDADEAGAAGPADAAPGAAADGAPPPRTDRPREDLSSLAQGLHKGCWPSPK